MPLTADAPWAVTIAPQNRQAWDEEYLPMYGGAAADWLQSTRGLGQRGDTVTVPASQLYVGPYGVAVGGTIRVTLA
jgi:hypothetical protein